MRARRPGLRQTGRAGGRGASPQTLQGGAGRGGPCRLVGEVLVSQSVIVRVCGTERVAPCERARLGSRAPLLAAVGGGGVAHEFGAPPPRRRGHPLATVSEGGISERWGVPGVWSGGVGVCGRRVSGGQAAGAPDSSAPCHAVPEAGSAVLRCAGGPRCCPFCLLKQRVSGGLAGCVCGGVLLCVGG